MLIPIIFHKIYLYSAATVSLLANGMLLLLHQSSGQLGNYRILLATFALTDILISLFHAWYIPMFVLGEFGYICFGFRTFLKKGSIPHIANAAYSTLFQIPFCLLCLHFIYRYLILAKPTLVRKPLFMVICTAYFMLFAASSCIVTITGTKPDMPARFSTILDGYGIRAGMEPKVLTIDYLEGDMRIDKMEIFEVFLSVSNGGHPVLISIWCIHKINKAINSRIMEISTRRMHVHLFRALLIQFTIPVVLSLIPMTLIFGLPATGISVGEYGNLCGLLASGFPALDPILIIGSYGRFRTILIRWFDVLTGNMGRRNEKNALEQSRIHHSMITRRSKS